jgi:hypothetical protein
MKLLRLLLLFILVSGVGFSASGQVLTEDFEGTFAPTGWSIDKNSGNDWTESTSNGVGGSKCARYVYNGSSAADSWLFTSGVALTSGTSYTYTFYQAVQSANYAEQLKFTVGTGATIADQTTTLVDLGSVTNTTYVEYTGTFTPSSTGTYYFAFQCYSNANQWNLYVDDLTIELSPSCLDPTALATSSVTTTSASLDWTANSSESNWEIVVQAAGTGTPAAGYGTGTAISTKPHSATSLTANTAYEYYVRADCNGDGSDLSDWAGPFAFTTLCANETAPYTESFDASISSCWSQSATSGGPWVLGSSVSWNTNGCGATPSDNTGNAGSFIAMDHSTTPTDEAVVIEMPIVDVTALTTPQLNFYHFMCITGSTTPNQLYVEAWDGSAWNSVATITTGAASWAEYSYVLTTHVYSGSLVKIRFRAEPGTGNVYYGDQALDDISIEEAPACPSPSAMAASPIAGTTADLAWAAGAAETNWNLEWKAGADFVAGNSEEDGSASPTTTATHSLSGLTAVTTYYVYYQADCGGDQSDWIGPYSFTTTILCPAPSGMGITGTTTTTGSVSWTAGGTETTWDLEWKAGANFTPGTGAEDGSASPTTTPVYTMTSLTQATTYYVHYRANCGGGNGESDWVYAGTITTDCASQTLPWTEDFESMASVGGGVTPNCWFESGDWASASATGSNNRIPNSGTNYIYTSWTADDWLISPAFDLTGGTAYTYTFQYVTDGNSGWTTIEAAYGTVQDGASMTTAIGTPVSSATNTSYAEYTVTFTPASTGTYYFGVHVIANGSPWYISFDDFELKETPTADAEVTNLALPTGNPCSSLSATETITVTVRNNASADIAIGDASVALTGVTATPITNTGAIAQGATEDIVFTVDMTTDQLYSITATVTLTGDSDNTNDSDNGSVSSGIGEKTAPFSCDFTSYSGTDLGCDGFFEAEGASEAAAPTGTSSSGWGASIALGNTAKINLYDTGDHDWLITPTFDCGPITAVGMKIALTNYNSSDADSDAMEGTDDAVYVKVSADCGITWTTLHTFNDANTTGIISNTLTQRVVDLSAYNGQTIQIGIQGSEGNVDDGPDYDFHVGDIEIDNIGNLPVELTTFTAKAEGTTNRLLWETASEENNSHFEVERSTNGVDFEKTGTVEGNGTIVEVSNYNFVDETPATVSYYRLRQVDFDGNFEHSNVVMVKRDNIMNNDVTLYPVPVKDRLTVQYATATDEDVIITVIDVTGRKLITKTVNAVEGENQFHIDFTELPAGSYFVRLQSDLSITVKIVIKK